MRKRHVPPWRFPFAVAVGAAAAGRRSAASGLPDYALDVADGGAATWAAFMPYLTQARMRENSDRGISRSAGSTGLTGASTTS